MLMNRNGLTLGARRWNQVVRVHVFPNSAYLTLLFSSHHPIALFFFSFLDELRRNKNKRVQKGGGEGKEDERHYYCMDITAHDNPSYELLRLNKHIVYCVYKKIARRRNR